MKNLKISKGVLDKLAIKHQVDRRDVEQCFDNIDGPLLTDNREDHRSDPPTLWFLSRTNRGRLLKIAYIQRGLAVHLRTCYEPNQDEINIYLSNTKRRVT
ncbi:MAG: ADP-ribosyl-(dinitrogen reductase) hydrolase [Hyphomicrobiales bacterium]|nr:MAG: ADP-ribosyl-(dinitrogen reductase) hydrolase [Hyphomicrobiales bacterium]